jgi:hypothetical protein
VWSSVDGRQYESSALPEGASAFPTDVTTYQDGFVAVGYTADRPMAWWSPNGRDWTASVLPSDGGIFLVSAVLEFDGLLLAVGSGVLNAQNKAVAWTSSDGQSWGQVVDLGSGSAEVLLGGRAGVLAVGTSVDPQEPLAWFSPAEFVMPPQVPTPEPSPSPATVSGPIPGPSATPFPGALPIPGLTLDAILDVAGALNMTCASYPATIPDSNLTFGGLSCSDTTDGTEFELDSLYWSPTAIGEASLRVLPSTVPDRSVVDRALVEFAGLRFDDAQPDDTREWLLANGHRYDCLIGVCELGFGPAASPSVILNVQLGYRGALQARFAPPDIP